MFTQTCSSLQQKIDKQVRILVSVISAESLVVSLSSCLSFSIPEF
jgi:hypothetical protein